MWLFNDFAKRWDFSRIKQNSLTFPWLFPGDCGNAERIDVSSKSIMQKINNIIYPLHDAFGTYHPVLQTCFRVFHCTLRSPRSCFYISTPLQSMRHSTIPHYDLISIKPFQYTKLKQVEGTQLTVKQGQQTVNTAAFYHSARTQEKFERQLCLEASHAMGLRSYIHSSGPSCLKAD